MSSNLTFGTTHARELDAVGSVDWIGTYWSSFDGVKSVDMSGLAPGELSQSLATTGNNSYMVDFCIAGNPSCAPATKTLTVSATGAPSASYTFSAAGKTLANMGWTAAAFSFTATSASTTLTFSSTTAGSCGPALDLVTLTETVATAADCKKDGWRQLSDSAGTRFKNQGDCVSYYSTDGRNLAGASP